MSNTIDERVVVLKFDNKEFETNAQKSLETLDKLDKGMQLGDMSKSMSGFMVSSKSLGLSSISDSVDALSKRFSNMGIIGMTAMQEITKAAMRTGQSLINKVMNPIIEGGKRRAANIEQADFMLHGLIDDEAQIEAISKAAADSVDQTAFSLDAASKAAAQFTAAGVETGEQLNTVLSAVAGTAATFNTDYQGIANIFTKIAGQGRVQGDEFNQLTERGVPALDIMVKYLNGVNDGTIEATDSIKSYVQDITGGMEVAGDAVVDFRKKGLLTFDLFSAAMSNSFGKNAKKANDTVTGVLSNINSAFARTGAAFIGPLIKSKGPLVQFLESVRLKINDFNKAMGPFAEAVTEAINKRILPAAQKLVESIPVAKISGFFNLAAGWVRTVFKLGKSVQEAAEKPKKAMEELNEAVKMISPKEAAAAWDIWNKGLFGNGEERKKLLKEAGLSYENVQGYVNELIDAEFDLSKVETKVGEAGSEAAKKAAAAKVKVNDVIEKQKKELSPAVKLWFSFKSTLSGIADIGKAIGNAFKKIRSNFKMTVKPTESLVDRLFEATWRFKAFTSSLQLSDKAAKGIATVLQFLGDAISTVASVAGKAAIILGGGFIKLIELAGGAIYNFFSKVSTNVDNQGGLAGIIGKLRDRFVEFITAVGNSEGFKKFTTEARNFGTFVKDKFLGAMEKLNGLFSTFTGFVMKATGAKNFTDLISKAFGNLGTLIEKLRGGKEAIKEFFNAAKEKIDLGKIFSFGGGDKNDGEGPLAKLASIKDKFVDTIQGIFVNDKTITITTKIKDFFKKIGDILGEVDWNKLIQTGMSMVRLYAAFSMVRSFDKLAEGISGALGSVSSLAEAAKNKIKVETLKAFATSVLILTGAIFVLSTIPADKLKPSVEAMMVALGSMVGVIAILDKINASSAKMSSIGIAFAGMGAAILMLSIAAHQIISLKKEEMEKAGLAILALLTVLTVASKFASGFGGIGFASMALAIYILAPAMKALADVDFEEVKAAAKNLAIIMGVLAVAARIAGGAASGAVKMLALALAVDLMIPAILILANMPFEQALQGAGFLSGIMLALGFAVKIAGGSAGSAATMVAMAVACVAAAAVVLVLGAMPWETVLQGVAAIAAVMFSIAGAAKLASNALTGAVAIGVVLTLLVIAFYVLISLDVKNVMVVALSLSGVLIAITAAMAILSAIPFPMALQAVGNLAIFFGALLGALTLIGKIQEWSGGKFGKAIDKAKEIMQKAGEAVGALIGGFGKGMSESLPAIGENLGSFYEKAAPFFEGMRGFDASVLQGVSDLASAMLKFTGGNILDNLQKVFTGQSSMEQIGTELSNFVRGFLPAALLLKMVPEGIEEKAGTAIGTVQAVSKRAADIQSIKLGDMKWLVDFASAFVQYSNVIGQANVSAALSSSEAIKNTAEAISSISAKGIKPKALTELSSGIVTAMDTLSNAQFGDLSPLKNQIGQLAEIINTASALNPGAIGAFVKACNEAGKKGVNGFIEAFTDSANRVKRAVSGMIQEAASALDSSSFESSARTAGANVGQGFVNGIVSKRQAAYDAGFANGQASVRGFNEGGGTHSPSIYTTRTGEFMGQGLVNGIRRWTSRAYRAGYNMAHSAADAVGEAVDRISDLMTVNEDDFTITPVLDLSGVEAGASRIGSLLDGSPTVGMMARVGSVNASMVGVNNQNEDLIRALKGLERNSNNSNTFNITVDGSENPEEFANRLVRLMKVRARN